MASAGGLHSAAIANMPGGEAQPAVAQPCPQWAPPPAAPLPPSAGPRLGSVSWMG